MKIRSTALVKGFRQSAPYVNAHRGKTMVVMLGGEAIADKNFPNIISDIALLHSLGVKVVLVHELGHKSIKSLKKINVIRHTTKVCGSLMNPHSA